MFQHFANCDYVGHAVKIRSLIGEPEVTKVSTGARPRGINYLTRVANFQGNI